MLRRGVFYLMKYSEVIITDYNMDEEMELLADNNGYVYNQFIGFFNELNKEFTIQQNKNGYEEWVDQRSFPNHSIDCITQITESVIAYEFGNGFMLFGECDSMWD